MKPAHSEMKRIIDIIDGLPIVSIRGDAQRLVSSIEYDSRRCQPESAFVAIPGLQVDGHQFVSAAYDRGARTFVVEHDVAVPEDATIIQVENTRQALPYISQRFYHPAVSALKFIGVTGTNGKTTTAYLIHSILQAAGWRVGLVSSVEYRTGKQHYPAERTTPEAVDLHRLFYEMYRNGLKGCVMEVSSHALELHRVDGMEFTAAVFTNLSQDHLDFHGDMENYFLAKAKLFQRLTEQQRAIINLDDPYGQRLVDMTPGDVFTYSLKNPAATVYLKSKMMGHRGIMLTIALPGGDIHVQSNLSGRYNAANILAAITTALSLGITEDKIAAGVEQLQAVPGRLERFVAPNGAQVFVDYAHTADAMARVMENLLEMKPGKLIVVFGAGGDRDAGKRPKMGQVADQYADEIILTTDNSRSEPTEQIIQDIQKGISNSQKVAVILDREAAIRQAIQGAGGNDIVLIAGKGHEDYLDIQGKKIPFDDREVVRRVIAELDGTWQSDEA